MGYENGYFCFYQVWYWEKVNSLQKFRSRCYFCKICVSILIFSVFSKSVIQYLWHKEISVFKVLIPIEYSAGIQYLWQGEISVCKALMPIKYSAGKEGLFPSSKIWIAIDISKWTGFWVHFPANTNLNFIRSTCSKSSLVIKLRSIFL